MPTSAHPYIFVEPTQDHLSYSAQLQEWADSYKGKVQLTWDSKVVRLPNGNAINQVAPVVNGVRFEHFIATDPKKQAAKNKAAGQLIHSGALLVIARSIA
ncbi:hypothetical protein RhiLY_01316 [Ceratobasidium sp. AG-Ba]|nr:hypothetical protein RhiLY_01316 [Ceratobasidium sp. AG-Ba]